MPEKTFHPREMPRERRDTASGAPPCKALEICNRRVVLFPLGRAPRPVIWVHMPEKAATETAALLSGENLVLAAVTNADWDRELSPWPAPRAFHGGQDFSGSADKYLAELTDKIIPAAEAALPEPPLWRGVAGYSLAGLFAAYAAWKTAVFSRFASVSGSLWFDGFLDFLKADPPAHLPEAAYFSLGSLEKNAKNPRLATVEEQTRRAEALLHALGVKTVFEQNEGGHFSEAASRMARGIRWLLYA